MASDIVQAVFSSAAPGSDLAAFAPAVGSGFAPHPLFASHPLVATTAHRFRVGAANCDTLYINQTAPPAADYSARLKATMINPTGTDTIGPVIRCSGSVDTFYTFVWIRFTNVTSGLALFKHVNGTASQVGTSVTTLNGQSVIPTAGAEAVIQVAVAGSTLTGSFNGAVAFTHTEPDITAAGLGGLYIWSGTADDGQGLQAEEFYLTPGATASGGGSGTGTGTSTAVTLGVTSSAAYFSPLNWDDDGTGAKPSSGVRPGATTAWSNNNGAEGRFAWTTPVASGNVATLLIDTSLLSAGSVATGSYPKIKYRINDGPYQVAQIPAGTGGLASLDVTGAGVKGAGTYTLRYVLMATSQGVARWTPPSGGTLPPNCLKITGLSVDAGSTPVAPAVLGKILAVFGDSITEGVEATGTNNGDLASNDSTLTYVRVLAAGLGAEPATIGFGGQGWEITGGGGVVPFSTAFGFYSANRPRDFSTAVDYVVCTHGTNDGLNNVADSAVTTDAAAWLAAARGKFGTKARIFLCVPFGGFKRAALAAAFSRYQAATPDTLAYFVDGGVTLQAGLTGFVTGGTWAAPGDGVHPDAATHARIAGTFEQSIVGAILGSGGSLVPPVAVPVPPAPVVPTPAAGALAPSGATFHQLRSGGLSGQIDAILAANPTLDLAVVEGLHAGSTGTLDRTYQAAAGLVESYLRGDPIATTDVNARLADYAQVFAGIAQSTAEVAALVSTNPGTLGVAPASPHATIVVPQRSFPNS